MQLTLVMPCYNRALDLQRVLEAYDRQETDVPFEILAVDDASTDHTYAILTSYQPQRYSLRVERMGMNSGQGRARNRVVPFVNAPIMMFVGDDMLPQPGFIQGHLNMHRHNPQENLAVLGKVEWPKDIPCNTLMKHIDGIGAQQFSYYYMRSGREYDFRHFYTCNISVKTSFFKALPSWFDPDFYLYGYEDVEVGYRLAQNGMRIVYQEDMIVQHYHYYNVWGFAKRQFNSGVMLNVLIRKHPDLLDYRPIGDQYKKVMKVANSSAMRHKPLAEDQLSWLNMAACRLASFYEWYSNHLVDKLYLALFDYFNFAGILDGMSVESSRQERLNTALARRYLIPALDTFISEALRTSTPLPPGYDLNFLRKLKFLKKGRYK
jgi:glycosyltransferase involved in cell wall biosynthesis